MTCSYIVYQAAVENRDDLHASEEDLALVGQDVEDGQELPNSQQQEEELPELSALPPQLFKQEVLRSRGQQLSMYLFEGGRGAVASTTASREQNEFRRCRRDSLIKLTLISFCISTDKNKMLF